MQVGFASARVCLCRVLVFSGWVRGNVVGSQCHCGVDVALLSAFLWKCGCLCVGRCVRAYVSGGVPIGVAEWCGVNPRVDVVDS